MHSAFAAHARVNKYSMMSGTKQNLTSARAACTTAALAHSVFMHQSLSLVLGLLHKQIHQLLLALLHLTRCYKNEVEEGVVRVYTTLISATIALRAATSAFDTLGRAEETKVNHMKGSRRQSHIVASTVHDILD